MPSSLLSVYSPLKGRSVPFIRVTRYCSGVSWSCHSSSVFCIFLGVSVMSEFYHAVPRLLTAGPCTRGREHVGRRPRPRDRRSAGSRARPQGAPVDPGRWFASFRIHPSHLQLVRSIQQATEEFNPDLLG